MPPLYCCNPPPLLVSKPSPPTRAARYAAANNAEGLRQLLMSGAVKSVRALDSEGRHALNIAIASNNGTEAIKLLLEVDPGGVIVYGLGAQRYERVGGGRVGTYAGLVQG